MWFFGLFGSFWSLFGCCFVLFLGLDWLLELLRNSVMHYSSTAMEYKWPSAPRASFGMCSKKMVVLGVEITVKVSLGHRISTTEANIKFPVCCTMLVAVGYSLFWLYWSTASRCFSFLCRIPTRCSTLHSHQYLSWNIQKRCKLHSSFERSSIESVGTRHRDIN